MAATQRYRAQHAELLALTDQISALIGDGEIAISAVAVRSLVSVLAGKLSIHLAVEDKTLYPSLMAHSDPDVRALAARYAEEMGSLSDEFTRFNRRWLTATLIEKEPKDFVGEAGKIIEALRKRIEKENDGLYTLVDEIE